MIEVALAKDEMRRELRDAKAAGISLALGAVIALIGLTMLFVALGLAFESAAVASLVIGAILLGAAGAAGAVGVLLAPRKPLGATRDRLRADVRALNLRSPVESPAAPDKVQ